MISYNFIWAILGKNGNGISERKADEIRHDEKQTKEHFDQILKDITEYERYCKEHRAFPNNKAVFAIKNIKNIYQQCTDEGTFL